MEIIQTLSDFNQLRDNTALRFTRLGCESQGPHQTNTINTVLYLHVVHDLAVWHPLRQHLERINRNTKTPEDVGMIQLCPRNNLLIESLEDVSQLVVTQKGESPRLPRTLSLVLPP